MPNPTPADRPADRPADQLRAAAVRARETGDPLHTALAEWLTCEQGVVESAHLWAEREGCGWCGNPADAHALAVARQLLGTTSCGCAHPADEHSVYGCAEDCACEWMPPRTPAVPPAPADRAAEAKAATTVKRLRAERAELSRQLDCLRGDMRDMEAHVREQDAEFERIRRAAGEAAAGAHHPTTADRAAALGMTPTEYRQHSHNTAVQQIRDAARGLFAGTAIRVADALKEPDEGEADTGPLTEEQLIRQHVTTVHLIGDQLANVESWLWQQLADARDTATPAVPAAPRDLTARWDEATGKPTPLCPCGYLPVACDADRGCTRPAVPAAPEETQ